MFKNSMVTPVNLTILEFSASINISFVLAQSSSSGATSRREGQSSQGTFGSVVT